MHIRLNGRECEIRPDQTLLDILAGLSLDPYHVVVEVNRTILTREELGSTCPAPGDVVEIIRFVGGG